MSDDTGATGAGGTPDTPAAPAASTDEVTTKLTELGVDAETIGKIKTELGVTSVTDLSVLAEKDLLEVGMKAVPARKLITAFAPPPPAADTAALSATAIESLLPSVPDDASWLEALKTGGVLKVDMSTVMAAIRAALATRVGLFDVPARLVEAMETFADTNDEQVDPMFWKLREQLTRRNYAEVFQAIPGLTGSYVTEARKKQLLDRIDRHLWPAINSFYAQLQSWNEAWRQMALDPMVIFGNFRPGGGPALPPNMLQPPDTSPVRDEAEAVADACNRVFSGTGVQITATLAYDATQIRKTLEDPRLPALIGAANRDQMLKTLGVAVSSTYPRLEVNLTKFVLAALSLKDQPAGNEELGYLSALWSLGIAIPWSDLGGGHSTVTGIGGRNRL